MANGRHLETSKNGNVSSDNIQKFCSLVHCIDWNDVYLNNDVDVCYSFF